jgi:hypothetical protein
MNENASQNVINAVSCWTNQPEEIGYMEKTQCLTQRSSTKKPSVNRMVATYSHAISCTTANVKQILVFAAWDARRQNNTENIN